MSGLVPISFLPVRRIVSGGQTGVDRAALDVAIELGLEHGGWCPRGRRAEDGVIDARYNLQETRSARYYVRTRRNVRESDGTLIISWGALTGGTELTLRYAQKHNKPHLWVELPEVDPLSVRRWLAAREIQTLNVAGPRESTAPGVYRMARSLLQAVLAAESSSCPPFEES
jgi:hypothetical protein